MKISGSLKGSVLLVALIASNSLAAVRIPACQCGGLGAGTDPCRSEAECPDGGIPVKAAIAPKPFLFASEAAINEAAAVRDAAARAAAARAAAANAARSRSGYGCGHGPASGFGKIPGHSVIETGPTAQDLLSLDPHTPIAPRFKPIGDLCHTPPSPLDVSGRTTTTVVPAYPGKPRCFPCNGPIAGCGPGLPRGLGLGRVATSHFSGLKTSVVPGISGIPSSGAGSAGCGYFNLPGTSGPFGTRGPFGGIGGPFGCPNGPFTATGVPGSFGSGVPNSLSSSNPILNEFDNEDDEGLSFAEQEKIYNGQVLPQVPADAVSVTLAYKNLLTPRFNPLKKAIIPEERLSFGPRTIPADGRVQKTPTTDVPEEKLQIVDKPIVELKSLSSGAARGVGPSVEDLAALEALERERMELESAVSQTGPGTSGAYITYSDLGYGPIGPSRNQFIISQADCTTPLEPPPPREQEDGSPCGPLGPPLPGYRPGSVIVRHERISKKGHVEDGSGEDGYDVADSYEQDDSSSESNTGSSRASSLSAGLSRLWKQASHHRAGSDCFH